MIFCRYHPSDPALYHCETCSVDACTQCTDEAGNSSSEHFCFTCKSPLEHLGSGQSAKPFWRQLDQAFRYPLHKEPLSCLIIAAIISLAGLFIPFVGLLAAAFIYKYCFCCLEETALGNMTPPDVNNATTGGFVLLFQIIGIIVVNIGAILIAAAFVGETAAILVLCFVTIALPAAFMILAIDKEFGQAINPSKQWQLMVAIGPSYLILLIILFIMMSSVGLLNLLISENFSAVGEISSFLVSNYYAVVIFHLMGYTLFQYQDKLGLVEEEINTGAKQRTPKQRCKARASILLKEGDYQEAANLYHSFLNKFPKDTEIADRVFNLLLNSKNAQGLDRYADQYLQLLFDTEQNFKVSNSYKQLVAINPGYQPHHPKLKIQMADQLHQLGDFKNAALLLKNFHKENSDERLIIHAYSLMVEILEKLPNAQKQREQYQKFVLKLRAKIPEGQQDIGISGLFQSNSGH